MALFEIDLQMNWDNALSYLLSLSFYCRDLREPISLSSVVEPTLFDLWQTISGDWNSVTWRLTALFTFLVLSSGSRLTDYKHQETNWQDNAHHHTTKPSRNNTPLMVLHSSRGQINIKKNYPEYIYISNCREKVTRWSLIDMWWWNCVYHFLLLSIARQISCSFVRLFLLRFHEILGFEKRPMPPIDTWKLWPWFFFPYNSATLSGQDRRHFIAVAVNYWFQIHGD